MKKRIIEIDGDDYIKKSHYDKLEKKKIKNIYKKARLIAPDNFSNTLCVIRWDDEDMINHIFKGEKPEVFDGELNFISPKGDKPLRVMVKDTIFSYDYFIQADRIAEAFGYDKGKRIIYKSSKPDKPIIFNYNRISVLIAPRVDDDIFGEVSSKT